MKKTILRGVYNALCIMLCMVLVLAYTPVSAFADDYEYRNDFIKAERFF